MKALLILLSLLTPSCGSFLGSNQVFLGAGKDNKKESQADLRTGDQQVLQSENGTSFGDGRIETGIEKTPLFGGIGADECESDPIEDADASVQMTSTTEIRDVVKSACHISIQTVNYDSYPVYSADEEAEVVCRILGYANHTIDRTRKYDSPGNNSVLKYTAVDSSATVLKGKWSRVPAKSYNRKIHSLTCSGKIKQGCIEMQKKEVECN